MVFPIRRMNKLLFDYDNSDLPYSTQWKRNITNFFLKMSLITTLKKGIALGCKEYLIIMVLDLNFESNYPFCIKKALIHCYQHWMQGHQELSNKARRIKGY